VNTYCRHILAQELTLRTAPIARVEASDMAHLRIDGTELRAEKMLVSIGRRANTAGLGLEALGVTLDERGVPSYDPTTMQVADLPIFLAGDITSDRPLLHEAADEGRIAGFNCVQAHPQCFQRRVPLSIVFCEPNVAVVGQAFADLQNQDLVIGAVRFDNQGRARVLAENTGMLRVYAAKPEGRLVGAELVAPRGEHLAHLLAWVMQKGMTVFDVLQLPFYHPVVEEGLRTALREVAKQVKVSRPASELVLCESVALGNLS
jgi:dihydrolipoamide dehydrogenase